MRALLAVKVLGIVVVVGFSQAMGQAQTVIDSDFSKGSFAALGWKAKGDWDVFQYPKEAAHNPGPVARFAAHKPDGSLTKTFDEAKNPKKLNLSLDYGWGWGDADQGSPARPGRLNYSILDQPPTAHDLLLEKSDGTLELIVWGERLKGSDELTVRLGRAYPSVKVYDPTVGTEPIRDAGRVDSLKLTVSDHPLIIAIVPK